MRIAMGCWFLSRAGESEAIGRLVAPRKDCGLQILYLPSLVPHGAIIILRYSVAKGKESPFPAMGIS